MSANRRFVSIRTNIPGEQTKKWLAKRQQYIPNGVGNNTLIFAKRAKGAVIEDIDGNIFLDFAGAIGSLNAGHSPSEVIDAIKRQVDEFIHTCFHVAMYKPYVELAKKLSEITPGTFLKKTILLNSGAEAVENAVKIARKYTGRSGIVSFTRGFHGRTLLGMSLTSKVKPYKYKMGPFAPAIYKASFPNVAHRPSGMCEKTYADFCLRQFEEFLLTEVAPEEIAAVIMEPVQGEGGFIVPPVSFVQGVFSICKQHGILFIADEIQTGFGRTGEWFASTHYNIEPDIITLSKSIAAGVPISAVTGRAEVMDAPAPGEIGGTYGGSPLGCVAALAVIEKMERENMPRRAQAIGKKIIEYFAALQSKYDIIHDVRGIGAMCAVELVDPKTKEPLKSFTAKLTKACYERGVIVLSAGVHSNVLRFLTPLVISDEELEEGLEIIQEALELVYREECWKGE
ncbi:4-aminobutyrate--2-oxoglutarate transaminase [Bacillus sp. 165]|uniref:4-aminobutyrate--2-oxoglutarate transaminase n=1 Tax=Bacillus sp. 165 TaxID=1529117 RepID=UPI001ADC644B|nr:4-aminobutyrate--2-oxoglutarate transaminase [Bacillus sp. 165]MBO9129316.1 4-aminobutyrate--2-oxoglutarate transaminase [Bacillus sp. 165]